MNKQRKQILLTNDDGIQSPGLWAAAEALSTLGYVTVAAPRDQASGTGRSMPVSSDGRISAQLLQIGEQEWTSYAVGGTPAQTVIHAILELMPRPPDLIVSGINYGENVGSSITISGTVGASMEGAAFGIPSLAMSLQLENVDEYMGYSRSIDFSAAAFFTQYFARLLLEQKMPEDVDLLKVDVPYNATPATGWRMTRLARHRYFLPAVRRKNGSHVEPAEIYGITDPTINELPPESDIYTLLYAGLVAVTPLSLDMTSRVSLTDLEKQLRQEL